MERLMLLPCLVFLLVGLVSPVNAEEGTPPDLSMDGIVAEDPAEPPPADLLPVPDSGDGDELPDVPSEDGTGSGGLDGITSSVETADYTAVVESLAGIQETLSRLELLLSYIFVACLFVFIVSSGKLIYSFFNMFF